MREFQSKRISELDDTRCSEPECERYVWRNGMCSLHAREATSEPMVCGIKGCERTAYCRGLCMRHYRQKMYRIRKREGRLPPGVGTVITDANQRTLAELGITYRQWNYWHTKGWLQGSFDDVDRPTLERLARAAKIQALPLNELADLLKEKELERL